MHPSDYTHCQAFAEIARAAKVEVIRYASVRDPSRGMNLALLTCRAFANTEPIDQQTWRLRLSETGAQAVCEMPKFGITFDRKSFAVDPRIAKTRLVRT
ncbi:MAG: RES family NAD+ phosphorylase [Thermomicrobiales bacterium]